MLPWKPGIQLANLIAGNRDTNNFPTMKLEYLHDLTDGGKYKQVVSENLVRLYDFDERENSLLIDIFSGFVNAAEGDLDLSTIDFIEPLNCTLMLRLSSTDDGILKEGDKFICYLTKESYQAAIEMMQAVTGGHQWLCDTSADNIDFLYAPGGTW